MATALRSRAVAAFTSTVPPLCLTIPNTVERPSPVPLPISFVVKNGSKIFSMISGGMPSPVSSTSMRT